MKAKTSTYIVAPTPEELRNYRTLLEDFRKLQDPEQPKHSESEAGSVEASVDSNDSSFVSVSMSSQKIGKSTEGKKYLESKKPGRRI